MREDNKAKAVEDVSAIETLAVEEGEGNSVKSEQLRVDPQQEGEIEGGQVWEQREPDVIIGQTDLVNKPSYKGNDLIRTAPKEIEQPADIKEQVFIIY